MYYLAYGSNLNKKQMATRCPGARSVGTAVIKGYRLMFKGSKSGSYLTIERDPESEVPVGVWEVTKGHIMALDRYEGYPIFYYKKQMVVECSDGRRHRAFVYIMHEDRQLALPSVYYIDTCKNGYDDFGLDLKFLGEALEYTKEGAA